MGLNQFQLSVILLIEAAGVAGAFLLYLLLQDVRYAIIPIVLSTLGMMAFIVLAKKGNR